MRLYIIGNGFDLAHGLKTRYEDFISSNRDYEKKYSIFKFQGENWNNIEYVMGCKIREIKKHINECLRKIEVDEIVDDIISNYGYHDYGYVNYYGYKHEELAFLNNQLEELTQLITEFEYDFYDYIKYETKKLDNTSSLSSIINLFSDESDMLFINFNYTETLEKLYGMNSVLHIHGKIEDKIKFGYNSKIAKFNKRIDNLDYPKLEDIKCQTKHDLPERLSRYQFIEEDDENGNTDGEYVPIDARLRFHNEVANYVLESQESSKRFLFINDKSKFKQRIDITNQLKNIRIFDEIIIIGHSLGEMDWDILDQLFKKSPNIKCSFYKDDDKKSKEKIIKKKKWKIDLFYL